MDITTYNISSNYYKMYELMNSDEYKELAVEASKVSEDTFNVEDMTSALEALNELDTFDFYAMGSVRDFSNDFYTLSQVLAQNDISFSDYLSDKKTGMSSIYDSLASINTLSDEDLDALTSSDSALSKYSDFLNNTSSLFDESI